MKLSRALCVVVLAGCGGPSFGPEQQPTAQQMASEQQAESSLGAFTADTIDPDTFGGMADSMFGLANGSVGTSARVQPLGQYAGCATVTPTRVDYNCSFTSGTNTSTVRGFVSRNASGGTVNWQVDLTVTANDSSSSTQVNTSEHLTGNVTVGNGQINGGLSLSANVHLADSNQSVNVSLNGQISYNHLTYDATQHCVTGGNLVLQVDAEAPNQSVSEAVRFTWTGCHMFTVAVAK